MATRMYEVQQKIYAALTSNEPLTSKVSGIYDYVPEQAQMPYVTFGHINSTSDYTKTDDGEDIKFTIDIWSTAKGRKEAVQILTLVEQVLEATLQLDTASIFYQRISQRDVLEESYGLFHAFVDVDFKLEWEE